MPDSALPPLDPRHLTFENLDAYWAAHVPIEIPVQGEPVCRLQLDPTHGAISLLTPLTGPEPDVSQFRNITTSAIAQDGETWIELRIGVGDSLYAAYGLLASVADRIQLMRESLAVAVSRAISEHRHILAGRGRLTDEQEIGLYGELLVLESLLRAEDRSEAVAAWSGPLGEEHDFVHAGAHVEVKTTTSERRRHFIGTLQQLQPVQEVPLWLLSIQITRVSQPDGRTLSTLVSDVRTVAAEHVIDFDDRLTAAGWNEQLRDLFTTAWALRTSPRCYRVDASFPALTETRLVAVIPRTSLLSDVSYRVDVTDLEHSDGPPMLAAFLATEGAAS